MLADMATEIDAARLLVHRAAWLARNGGYTNAEGSMSKLKAGRTAVWVTERAIQILGGYGYTREYPVERLHRDAKIYDIFEGTEQIQQLVIARAISGLRIEVGIGDRSARTAEGVRGAEARRELHRRMAIGLVMDVARWPSRSKIMMSSAGPSMAAKACGVMVANSAASPVSTMISRSPSDRRTRPSMTKNQS